MRIPEKPPSNEELLAEVEENQELLSTALTRLVADRMAGGGSKGGYLHWDKLRHMKPPEGLTPKHWWFAVKLARAQTMRLLPLKDKAGESFVYTMPDFVHEQLHKIDQYTAGHIAVSDEVMNPESRDRYIVSSLIEESITSSQLEGAATTSKAARHMLRTGRRPGTRGEQMILNNYRALEHIRSLRGERLTPELVLHLHGIVTRGALDPPEAAERLRRPDEDVHVSIGDARVHEPPPAEELDARLRTLCDFANGDAPDFFIHPVLRAIIVHFMLAYDHPFVDGNGRTARALFYWTMLSQDYWLFEFISISSIVRKGPAKYSRAFLYVETDDNDLTYFVDYHLQAIERSIQGLLRYIERKAEQHRKVQTLLRRSVLFNYRQVALLSHAVRNPGSHYTIKSHQRSHRVSYATARKDLLELEERGLLVKMLRGRTHYFVPVEDIEGRLSAQA